MYEQMWMYILYIIIYVYIYFYIYSYIKRSFFGDKEYLFRFIKIRQIW